VTRSHGEQKPSRGHKKRERTRRQLVEAGLAVLAEKGDALTISDVAARAEVSNGTFYNYFRDRDDFVDALAEHSVVSLAARAAMATAQADPAVRFAFATAKVLRRALADPTWGRAILRLVDHRRSSSGELHRYMREDLASGFDAGRFAFGPDDVTLDLMTGLILMTMRRIVRGEARQDDVASAVERALRVLGVEADEAAQIAADAARAEAWPPSA